MAGIDSYTKLLLHCNGANGSTSFPDSSSYGHTVTRQGDAQISTAQYKFGGASGLFDGTGDFLSVADSADWDFGTGDFTIDYWSYRTNTTTQLAVMDRDSNVISAFLIGYNLDETNIRCFMSSNGSTWDIADSKVMGTVGLNSWVHWAVVRSGTAFYTFKNGIQGATWTSAASLLASANALEIGQGQGAHEYIGYLDEIRISKGIARWTANFTPPTREYGAAEGQPMMFSGGVAIG